MHASHTREETRRLMFTRSLFPFSVKTLHDVFTLPCYRNDERCTEGDERDCTRTRKNIPMDGKFIFNFSFSDLYSALFTKELLWVSAGYKCLMYLDPLCGSMLQQDQGNKVDKYKTSPGAALCTLLCWNTYCEIITPKENKKKKGREGTKKRCTRLNHLSLPVNTSAAVFISWQRPKSLQQPKAVL